METLWSESVGVCRSLAAVIGREASALKSELYDAKERQQDLAEESAQIADVSTPLTSLTCSLNALQTDVLPNLLSWDMASAS